MLKKNEKLERINIKIIMIDRIMRVEKIYFYILKMEVYINCLLNSLSAFSSLNYSLREVAI